MVIGSASMFGGNIRPAPVSGARAIVSSSTPSSKTAQTKAASPFSPVLNTVLHPAPAPSQKRVTAGKTPSTADTNVSLVTGMPPVSAPSATGTTTPSTTVETTPTTQHATAPTPLVNDATAVDTSSVITTLKNALALAGVDTTGMQFTQRQDVVSFPEGSYVNDLISFKAASGQTHEYMANLTALAPQVTVVEIQQLMAGNRG